MGAQRDFQYHSGRLFGYYENKSTPWASFTEGLEVLEAFNDLVGFRLNSVTTLLSQIYKNIALKVNFTLHFNNDPALRPVNIDPATMMPFVLPADDVRFEKVEPSLTSSSRSPSSSLGLAAGRLVATPGQVDGDDAADAGQVARVDGAAVGGDGAAHD